MNNIYNNLKKLSVIGFFFQIAFFSFSQETCSSALSITDLTGATCISTSPGTVNDASIYGCEDGTLETYFKFVAQGANATISVTSASNWDPELILIGSSNNSCGGTLTAVTGSCVDPGNNTSSASVSLTNLVTGNTYWIVISSGDNKTTGTLTVCVTNAAAPSNDAPCSATSLTVNPNLTCTTQTAGTVANASASGISLGGCFGTADDDVWFSFIATNTTHYFSLNNVAGSVTDLYHSVYSGTCGALGSEILCSDPNSSTLSGLTIGNTYYVRVYTYSSTGGQTTTFNACITSPPPPPPPPSNNEPCSAVSLTVNSSCVYTSSTLVNATATTGVPAPGCASYSSSEDVWFTAVVPASGLLTVNTLEGTTTDSGMAFYTGTCGSLTLLECDDDDSENGQMSKIVRTGLTPGSTIFIRFWDYSGGTGTFSICASEPMPPANNDCAGAITLNSNTSCITTTGTTANATQTLAGCSGNADDDVWYKFVATSTSQDVTVVGSSGFDPVLQVFSVSCAGTSLVCTDDNYGDGTTEISNLTGLTIGNTYWVRVYDYGTSATTSTFTICVTEGLVAPSMPACSGNVPAGEACSTATPICNFDGYCGNTSGSYTVDTWSNLTSAFCGSLENDSYITFVASATTMNFYVWETSTVTNKGIQIMVFETTACGSGSVTQKSCWNLGAYTPGPTLVTTTGLTIGNTYYILVDGYAGDICDYVIGLPAGGGGVALPVSVSPSSSSICIGSPITLTASGGDGTYNWSTSPNFADLNATNTASVIASPGTVGSKTYTVTSNSGPSNCPSSTSASSSITVVGLPIATAGGTQTICSNGTATVIGASSSNGTILWTENGAGSITSGATTLTPVYTAAAGDAGNTVTLTMTVTSANGCGTATATYSVVVNPLPTATAGGTQTICSNGTATVIGASSSNGTILWTENGAGSITSGSTTLTPIYTAAAGDAGNTVNLTMTVTSNNSCSPQTATATYSVIVNPLPTATAGGTQIICSNGTATVSGASSSNGTILWTENGAGSITSGANTLTPVYTAAAGDAGNTVTLTMTVTSTIACTPAMTATATYSVVVNALPSFSTIGTSPSTCNGTNGNIVITGLNNSVNYNLTYFDDAVQVGPTLVTTNGSGQLTIATLNAGSYDNFTIQLVSSGCSSTVSTAVNLANPGAPNVNDISNQLLCNSTYTLPAITGTSLTVNAHYYTGINGTGTQLNPGNVITVTPGQDTTIYIYDFSGVCNDQENFTITVDALPTAVAGGSQTICSNGTANVSGASSSNGTILWTENGAGSITSGSTTLTPIYTPSAGDAGNAVTLTMTVTSNNACSPQTATANYTVNVTPLPTASAGGSQTICSNGTATVSGASSSNGNILWTHNGAGTLSNATTNSPTYTPVLADAGNTITLIMTVTSTLACTPAIQATANYTIIVNPLPISTSGATVSQTICSNGTATVSGSSASNGTISWTHNGAGSLSDTTTLTPTYTAFSGDEGNTVTLTMTVTSTNACAPLIAVSTYTVVVEPLPTASAGGGTQTICSNGTATVSGATASNGDIAWTENGTGTITGGSASLTPTYASNIGDAGNTVTLTMTVTSNNTCGSATAISTYNINVNPLPTASAGGSQTICSNGTATVSGAASSNGTILWSHDGFGSLSNATTLTPTYTAASGDEGNAVTLTMTVTSTIACSPAITDFSTYTINVNPLPTITNPTLTQEICSGSSATFSPTSGVVGTTFAWTASASAGTIIGFSASGSGNISEIVSNSAVTSGTVTYIVTPTGPTPTSCVGTPVNFVVTVNPLPSYTVAGVSPSTCNGTDGTITLSGLGNSLAYNITYVNGVTPVGPILLTSTPSGDIVINGLSAGTYTPFTAQLVSTGCSNVINTSISLSNPGAPNVFNITNVVQCSGTTYTLTTINGTALTGSQAYYDAPGNTGNMIPVGTVFTTDTTVYIYDESGICTDQEVFTITFNPRPTITNTTLIQAICSGSSATFTPTSGVASTTFAWTASLSSGTVTGFNASGTGNISELLTNTTTTAGTVTYVITPTGPASTSCVGSPVNFVVTVNPLPTYTITSTHPTVCSGNDGTIVIQGLNNTDTYYVEYFDDGILTLMSSNATPNTSGNVVISNLNEGVYNQFNVVLNGCSTIQGTQTLISPSAPVLDAISNVEVCDKYQLPVITGQNLISPAYYTGPNKTGTMYSPTDEISSSVTLYVYDNNNTCSDEIMFNVTINPLPTATITATQLIVCKNSTQPQVTLTGATGTAPYTFTYNVNGGATQTVTSSSGNSVVLNVPTTIVGSFTYNLIDVTDASSTLCSNTQTGSVSITVNALPTASISGSTSICAGQTTPIVFTGTPNSIVSYSFNNGITQTIALNSSGNANLTSSALSNDGTYTLLSVATTATPSCSQTQSGAANIVVVSYPVNPTVSSDVTYCLGEPIADMTASSNSGGALIWYADANLTDSLGVGTNFKPEAKTATFYITEMTPYPFCESSPSAISILVQDCEIVFPTAFTPDGDMINDTWVIENLDAIYPKSIVRIYNRWGNIVFESKEGIYEQDPWNGKFNTEDLPVASYYFSIEYNDGKHDPKKGTVTIIRK